MMKYLVTFLLILGMIVGWLCINPYPTADEELNRLIVIQEEI